VSPDHAVKPPMDEHPKPGLMPPFHSADAILLLQSEIFFFNHDLLPHVSYGNVTNFISLTNL